MRLLDYGEVASVDRFTPAGFIILFKANYCIMPHEQQSLGPT